MVYAQPMRRWLVRIAPFRVQPIARSSNFLTMTSASLSRPSLIHTASVGLPDRASPPRILSIDALRGFVMFTMIYVNDLAGADEGIVPNWSKHASDIRPRISNGMNRMARTHSPMGWGS